MKALALPLIFSVTAFYVAASFCMKIPAVQRFADLCSERWHADDDLRYQIRKAKIHLVEDFLTEVDAKIKTIEKEAADPTLWLDGTNHTIDTVKKTLKSDPDGTFEIAQYSLKRAWTVELTVYGEESVYAQESAKKRTSMLVGYRDKYEKRGEVMATRQAKPYAECLKKMTNAQSLAELDAARLPKSPQDNDQDKDQELAGMPTPSE